MSAIYLRLRRLPLGASCSAASRSAARRADDPKARADSSYIKEAGASSGCAAQKHIIACRKDVRPLKITKMHGLGNDFILVQDFEGDLCAAAANLCPRRTSVGADGLIAVLPSDTADVRMEIINADGSIAEMCGNGIRCFARYVYDHGLVASPAMSVETRAGIMYPQLLLEGNDVRGVRVNMGKPEFRPDRIPASVQDPLDFHIDVGGTLIPAAAVLMGVPHTIVYISDMDEQTLGQLGRAIEEHPVFPRKTNVNFVQVEGNDTLRVRTWERGAGRTMACGTGSCAASVVSRAKGLTGRHVRVKLDVGDLSVDLDPDGTVYMTGPAEYVYEAELPDTHGAADQAGTCE